MKTPEITIVDTSPRVGPTGLPYIRTKDKIALANSLMKSGVSKLDCVGFTHPRIRPEYTDAEKVVNGIKKRKGVSIIGLAPNEIACRRALNTDVDEIGVLIAGSESFNRALLGIPIKKSLFKTIPAIIQASKERGKRVRAFLTAAFWCQFEGRIEAACIAEMASKLSFLGVQEISLVDTPGLANPNQVKETVDLLLNLGLEAEFAVHFHNTRGMALANCYAAYEAGIRMPPHLPGQMLAAAETDFQTIACVAITEGPGNVFQRRTIGIEAQRRQHGLQRLGLTGAQCLPAATAEKGFRRPCRMLTRHSRSPYQVCCFASVA